MSDQTRVELRRSPNRSGTPVHGWPAILFGLPFLMAGGIAIFLSMTPQYLGNAASKAPMWILGAFGLIFALVGLSLIWHGIKGLRRASRAREIAARYPGQPWLADYAWDQRGCVDDTHRKVRRAFAAAVFLTVFLIPFNYIFFVQEGVPWFAMGVIGLFDVIAGLIWGSAVYLLIRQLKFGRSRVRFDRFPFFLGEPMTVHLCPGGHFFGATDATASLRCIEEAYEQRGTGNNRGTTVVCYQLYHDEQPLTGLVDYRPGQPDPPITFPLPSGDLSTVLSERPPRYWELTIHVDMPGVDYDVTFLLPIYTRC